MGIGRRAAVGALSALAVILLLIVGALFLFTATDWGRNQTRTFALDRLRAAINGEVEVARIEGHLLDEVRLIDVSIVDSAGRPFVRADTIATGYSLRGLLSKNIRLDDLRLVNAEIVLNRPPGEDWNFVSIFRSESEADTTATSGWGRLIELRDIRLIRSRITMRTAWEPPVDLTPAEQREAIRRALAGELRDHVVEVEGGFQNVMEFRDLDAEIARVLVAHPDTAAIPIDVEQFSGVAQPFNPPAAHVRDLSGRFRLQGDSLYFHDVEARLPGSRLSGDGFYAMEHSELQLMLEGAPLAFDDLRWLYPSLPEEGGGSLAIEIRTDPISRHIIAREMDLQVGESEIQGRMNVRMGDTLRVRDTDLQFTRLDTRLIERLVPAFDPPSHGRMTGTVALDGRPADMQLDADVVFDEYAGGTSRVLAEGRVGAGEDVRFRGLQVELRPLQADLLRAFAPRLPVRGTIEGSAHLTGTLGERMQLESDLVIRDPQTGVSRVAAAGGVWFGDAVRLDDLRLRLDPLQVDLLRPHAPGLPPGATATGLIALDGPLGGLMHVDGDLAIDDPATGVSQVAAHGGFDLRGPLLLQDVELRFDPLRMSLVRSVAPDLPLGGILEGSATVTGSPSARLSFVADLVHVEAGERSHVSGRGDVAFTPERRVDVDLQLHPLSLRTVGRYAPEAGLRGHAEGDLALAGTLGNLQIDADLRFADGGYMEADGRLDLESARPAYDIRLAFNEFDPSAVSERAPIATSLVGTAQAEGRGFDPATMQASLSAELEGLELEGYDADRISLQMDVDRGLATVAPSRIRVGAAQAEIEGTFGLVAGREGTLAYHVTVDSLDMLAPWIPEADTGVVAPRPAVREAAVAEAERAALDAQVELLATGRLSEPERDTLSVLYVPRDTLGGRLDASGTLRGNIEQFDADGRASIERFVYQGNYVERGEIDYTLSDVRSEEMDVTVDASFESLLVRGFAFDAAAVAGAYRGGRYGSGDVEIAIERDEASDLRLDTEFALSLEQNELRLLDMEVRLDTVQWSATETATVYWGEEGVSVDNFDLQGSEGGRVFIDGELPVDGPADLELVISDVNVEYLADILQEDREASGVLSLDARVTGTLDDPRIDGEVTLAKASLDGHLVPDVHAVLDYSGQELRAHAELVLDSLEIATAEIRVPVDLALGAGGPRLLERPMQIDVRADRLPLDALPAFTDQVQTVEGTIAANVAISGTPANPVLGGDVSLDLVSLDFAPLGIRFEPLVGHASLSGDVLRIDSLVAVSDGPARIDGEVRLESLTNPVFDLELEARDAWIIDTDDARLKVDADLTIEGAYESLEISGLVRTRQGVIYIPEVSEFGAPDVVDLDDPATFDRVDSLLLAQGRIVREQSTLFANVDADVEVEIDRDVWLRSTEANVEIYTPSDVGPLRLQMRGLQGLPRIEGTINTDRGEYEYLSWRFMLTRGSVTFTGAEELDPILQLAAEHEVQIPGREALIIRIIAGGTLRDLEITFESNAQPPISQSDLLSFLAFGREASTLIQGQVSSISGQASGGAGLVGNVAGIATQQFTAIALESMLSGLEADMAQDLGLDVVRITPAHLSADVFTGSYLDVIRGTEMEVGRYMGSRMFVAAQARPARSFPGVRFEYRTRQNFEWMATWRSRFIANVPTLRRPEANSVGVFGSFLFKEWRY